MASDNWLTRALADVRRELVENGWFGKPDARDFGGTDRVLNDKLLPDKIGDRGFLGWLEASDARNGPLGHDDVSSHQPPLDRGIDR